MPTTSSLSAAPTVAGATWRGDVLEAFVGYPVEKNGPSARLEPKGAGSVYPGAVLIQRLLN
jgi:hypothetical protein